MQQIERYGVIALVFMVVTVVAVYLWGDDGKDGLPKTLRETERGSSQSSSPDAAGRRTPPMNGRRTAQREEAEPPLASLDREDEEGALRVSERMLGGSQRDRRNGSRKNDTELASQGIESAPRGGREAGREGLDRPNASHGVERGAAGATPVSVDLSPASLADARNLDPGRNRGRAESHRPVPTAGGSYKVKEGDSLSRIAKRELGSETRWVDIAKLNGMGEPYALSVGDDLVLPKAGAGGSSGSSSAGALATPSPDATKTGRTYEVRKGDSLSVIAHRELGRASLWTKIEALNPSIDPKKLRVGQVLVMPAGVAPNRSERKSRIAQAGSSRDSRFRVH